VVAGEGDRDPPRGPGAEVGDEATALAGGQAFNRARDERPVRGSDDDLDPPPGEARALGAGQPAGEERRGAERDRQRVALAWAAPQPDEEARLGAPPRGATPVDPAVALCSALAVAARLAVAASLAVLPVFAVLGIATLAVASARRGRRRRRRDVERH